jgi:tetratricopeptide (TPR) repeat protein
MRRNVLRRIIKKTYLFCLLLLFSSFLWADGTIVVKSVDESGSAVEGVVVFAQYLGQGKTLEKKSNRQGLAEFKKSATGVYRIVGRKPGFAPEVYEFVVLKDKATENVQLTMRPGDMEKLLYFEDANITQQADQLLGEGYQLMMNRNLDAAEEKIKASLAINPSSPVTRNNMALVYMQQGKWDEATRELDEARRLGEIYLQIPSPDGSPNPMQPAYDLTLQLIQTMPLFRLQFEVDQAFNAQRWDEAIAKTEQVLKLQPDNSDVLYQLALAQAHAGRLEDAQGAIDRALSLNPGDKQAQELKEIIIQRQQVAEAQRVQKIIEEGQKLAAEGKHDEALRKYDEARAAAEPEQMPGLWLGVARAQAEMGNTQGATQAYQEAIKVAPEPAEFQREFADYLMKQKQVDQAILAYADYFKSTGTKPEDGLFKMAQDQVRQGHQKDALVIYEGILRQYPDHADSYYEVGMLYFYVEKDKDRAKDMLTKYSTMGKDEARLDNAKAVLIVISRQ